MGKLRSAASSLTPLVSRDPAVRYDGRHYLASEIAYRLGGFRTYNSNQYWPTDPQFLAAWNSFPETDGRVKDRRFILWSMARSAARLEGSTAECGVYNGSSSWLICEEFQGNPGWKHHMYDSYEGLSEPETEDLPEQERTFKWAKHDLAVGLERVQRNMEKFGDNVEFHPGWIPTAFPKASDESFAFVHVDVDLYQPTMDSIAWFYDRLVPGGILLCDDYGYESCPGAYRAFNEFVADKPERSVVHLTTGQGYIVKQGRPATNERK